MYKIDENAWDEKYVLLIAFSSDKIRLLFKGLSSGHTVK